MSIRTTVPTDIAHYFLVLDIFEALRRGLLACVDKPCSSTYQERDFNIGEVVVSASVVQRTTGLRRKFWAPQSKKLSLDEWIILIAGQQASIELALFRTDESEMPRWVQVAFANMENYGLVVTTPNGIVPIEAVWRPNEPKKVWDVELREATASPHAQSKPLNESYADFLRALRKISDFAKRSDRYEFVPIFDSVETLLESGVEMTRYAGCLLDETIFTPGARQLFEAIGRCWIFGGMDSWSDIIIQDPDVKREYETTTGHFYDALMQAVLSVANKGRIPFDDRGRSSASAGLANQ